MSETPRRKTGVAVAEDLVKMTYEKKVWEWSQVIDEADIPHEYFVTFSALVATTLSLLLPFWLTEPIVSGLSGAVNPPEVASIIADKYLPELKSAV